MIGIILLAAICIYLFIKKKSFRLTLLITIPSVVAVVFLFENGGPYVAMATFFVLVFGLIAVLVVHWRKPPSPAVQLADKALIGTALGVGVVGAIATAPPFILLLGALRGLYYVCKRPKS